MSRIYESKPTENTYTAVDRSVRYSPVQATTSDKQLSQYKNAVQQDSATLGRELSRNQQQERLELQNQQAAEKGSLAKSQQSEQYGLAAEQLHSKSSLQQTHLNDKLTLGLEQSFQKAKSTVSAARTQAISGSINSLLSFGGSALSYHEGQLKTQEQESIYDAEMEAAGLGSSFGSSSPVATDAMEASENTALIARAESTALNNATEDMASSSNAIERDEAFTARQQTMWKQLEPVRGAGYAASAGYPAALQEAVANGLIRPGAQGVRDAQEFTRAYAKATGVLNGVPREQQAKFARIASAANQNVVTSVSAQHRKDVQAANKVTWESNVSNIAESAQPGQIGEGFEQVFQETIHGNFGHSGKPSKLATQQALTQYTAELAIDGRTSDINELRDHVYNTATGRTLGQDFDSVLDAAVLKARSTAISNFDLNAKESTQRIKVATLTFRDNPTPENRAAAVAELRAIGSAESLAEANALVSKGMNADPQLAIDIAIQTQAGNPPDQAILKQYLDSGRITPELYKQYAKSDATVKAETKIDTYLKPKSTGYRDAIMGTAKKGDLTPSTAAELQTRHSLFMAELGNMVKMEVAANPRIADDPLELNRLTEKAAKSLLSEPRYTLTRVQGEGFSFAGDLGNPDTRIIALTNPKGMQDFSKIQPEQLFGGSSGLPKSEMNPRKDTFMSLNDLRSDAKAILEGGTASNRTRLIAKNLGISSRALVEAQLGVNGLPSLQYMKRQETTSLSSNGADLNEQTGFQALQAMGVPTKGAAYLAGNISQESAWKGTREWPGVMNPSTGRMDGTNRNGGLVSWASWSNDSARLGRIEAKYGKNISQISEQEQLNYMMEEMEASYPSAYRVFMSPNSRDGDLRRASYEYWGYGHEGARFTYASRILARQATR